MLKTNLPFDILNIILQYDGRIKYLHKKRIYVNVIHKNDYRYNILETKIKNKINLIPNVFMLQGMNKDSKLDEGINNKKLSLVYYEKAAGSGSEGFDINYYKDNLIKVFEFVNLDELLECVTKITQTNKVRL
jgi:hypothetical protein